MGEREEIRVTMMQNQLHSVAAMFVFMLTPLVESTAVWLAGRRFLRGDMNWVSFEDLRSMSWPPSKLSCASCMFATLLPVRALNIFTSFFSLKMMIGYFGTSFIKAPEKC